MATQKVPLTRIDETGASEGEVLKYTSGNLSWETDTTGGGGGGSGTAFKNTILGTESVSANSLEQYQVHSGLEILSGGSFTIAASGDLVLDAPDDPHKAAGWTDSGNVIHTTDSLNKIVIGQTTALSADDMLSVAGGNVTVAGSISAQGDVYGNARTMTNPGVVLQVVSFNFTGTETFNTADTYEDTSITANITPISTSSKILVRYSVMCGSMNVEGPLRLKRVIGSGSATYPIVADAEGNTGGAGAASTYAAYYANSTYMADIQSLEYLDSPSTTSNIVYTVQTTTYSSSYPNWINRVGSNATWTHTYNSTSGITLMEISG